MSTSPVNSPTREFALEVAERINSLGPITVTRFFGGAGLVADGVQFAFVTNGSVYFRVDDASRAAFEALGAKPFVYDGKAKTVTVSSYYEVPEEIIYDQDDLREWAVKSHRAAVAARLASPPKKRRKKSRGKTGI